MDWWKRWTVKVRWLVLISVVVATTLMLVGISRISARGFESLSTGGGCPSPWAQAAGFTDGVFPEGYPHSNGHMVCCGGEWVEGSVCASAVPEQGIEPEQDSALSSGGCPSEYAPGGVWPEGTRHIQYALVCCGGEWVEGSVCASAVEPTPTPGIVPAPEDEEVQTIPLEPADASEFPLTFSAYPYDEEVLAAAIEEMLAQYESPIMGYGAKIVAECKKWDVDPAFFMGNTVEETHAGRAYKDWTIVVDGVEYSFNEYFHNIIGYKPGSAGVETVPYRKKTGELTKYFRFESWDEMVEFWPMYIRTKYFDPETNFTGEAMDTLKTLQPIYGPGCMDYIEYVVLYRNQFLEIYNRLLVESEDVDLREEEGLTVPQEVQWRSNALMFHGIGGGAGSISVAHHSDLLLGLQSRGYTFISLDELLAAFYEGVPLPSKWLLLMYDDGRPDFYANAYPFLKAHNIPAVISIYGGHGMTNAQLQEIANHGLVTVAAHSRTHPHSSVMMTDEVSDAVLQSEILGSKQDLEALIGQSVLAYVWPGGGHGSRSRAYAEQVGFKIAFAVWGPSVQTKADIFWLGRFNVQSTADVDAQIRQIEQANGYGYISLLEGRRLER